MIRVAIVIGFVLVITIIILIKLLTIIIRLVIMVRIVCLLYLIRLRLGCHGSLMSLYGPSFHAAPIDMRIAFQCKLYKSCIMSCGSKFVYTCIKYCVSTFNGADAAPYALVKVHKQYLSVFIKYIMSSCYRHAIAIHTTIALYSNTTN